MFQMDRDTKYVMIHKKRNQIDFLNEGTGDKKWFQGVLRKWRRASEKNFAGAKTMGAFSLAMVQTRRAKQGGMGYQCWQEKDEKKGIAETGSQIAKSYYMEGKNAADKLMLAISRPGRNG